jgi:hypothetical protein
MVQSTRTPLLHALLALVLAFLPLFAFAQDKSAENFLRSIYGKAYIGKHAKGVDIDTRAQLDRYFTPELARRIDDDATIAAKRGDIGELDGDAFIGAQDFEIASFDISVQATDATHATGTVRFRNLGDARTVVVTLVRLKPGWRIADIDWGGDAGKLSTLFAHAK